MQISTWLVTALALLEIARFFYPVVAFFAWKEIADSWLCRSFLFWIVELCEWAPGKETSDEKDLTFCSQDLTQTDFKLRTNKRLEGWENTLQNRHAFVVDWDCRAIVDLPTKLILSEFVSDLVHQSLFLPVSDKCQPLLHSRLNQTMLTELTHCLVHNPLLLDTQHPRQNQIKCFPHKRNVVSVRQCSLVYFFPFSLPPLKFRVFQSVERDHSQSLLIVTRWFDARQEDVVLPCSEVLSFEKHLGYLWL